MNGLTYSLPAGGLAVKKAHLITIAALFALFAVAAESQDKSLTLGVTAGKPKADGALGAKEYAVYADLPKMKIALSLDGEALYIGISAETGGWVAVGLGAQRMEGAIIFIGYATGSRGLLKVQKGAGHGHGDVALSPPIGYAVKEANGRTTLEIAVKAEAFMAKGQKNLDMILAFDAADSFSSFHQKRYRVSVLLKQ
jgi:hypothetical protein